MHFEYEWQSSATGEWYRSNGKADCEFDANGYVQRYDMSTDDIKIFADERRVGIEK